VLVTDPGTGFVNIPQALEFLREDHFYGFIMVNVQELEPDPDRILKAYSEYLNKIAGVPPTAG
jgi:hypothetical protein